MTIANLKVAFVSVATSSHRGFAVAALNSITAELYVKRVLFLIGSEKLQAIPLMSNIEIRYVEDCLPYSLVRDIVSRYTPSEVCFALKPYLVKLLLLEGLSSVHYIDSDIHFFSRVDILEEQFVDNDILLTPHYLKPFPDDGCRPNVLALLRGGVFNAGYIGVRNTPVALQFLEWWGTRVLLQGKNEPKNGTCGDQRWLDLVPVLFSGCKVLRLLGANVAYWNLHERPLSFNDGVYKCGGEELLFFHFSGFDMAMPSKLSIYQNRVDDSTEVLVRLLADYTNELQRVMGDQFDIGAYAYSRWWHKNGIFMKTIRSWLRRNW